MRSLRLKMLLVCLVGGCGTRTGLLIGDVDETAPPDTQRPDAGRRPTIDAGELDALPSIDARRPDARPLSACPDAAATLVYVVTAQDELYSFYPADLSFTLIGRIVCPARNGTPFSMSVDQRGTAYVVFTDGELFRVSTSTAACAATPFVPNQRGFLTFGMGYAGDPETNSESLYVAQSDRQAGTSDGLGIIDTKTFDLRFVGPFVPTIPPSELTGTGDGRLFAWAPNAVGRGSHLYELDRKTGRVLAQNALSIGESTDAFAFAYWGGLFWIFTSTGGASTVTRYDIATGVESPVATLGSTIVGAGVSTCAPE